MEAGLTIVHTAEALAKAVAAGDRDIEIRSHLDLTTLPRAPTRAPYAPENPRHGTPTHLMYVDAPTRSIRGNCAEQPSAATATTAAPRQLELKPRQCVVAVGDSMMQFLGGRQWLDNLFFHLQPAADGGVQSERGYAVAGEEFVLMELGWGAPRSQEDRQAEVPAAEVYVTNVTVQGDRRCSTQVIVSSRGSKVLLEDSEFVDVHCATYPFHLRFEASAHFTRTLFHSLVAAAAAIDLGSGGLVRFHTALFYDINVPRDTWVAAEADDDIIIPGFDLTAPNPDVERVPVVVRYGNDDVACPGYFVVEEALVYDEQYALFDYYPDSDLLDFPDYAFLSPDDPWLLELRAALRSSQQDDGPPAPPAAPGAAPSIRPPQFPQVQGSVAVTDECMSPTEGYSTTSSRRLAAAPPRSPPSSGAAAAGLAWFSGVAGGRVYSEDTTGAVMTAGDSGGVREGMRGHDQAWAAATAPTAAVLLAVVAAAAMLLLRQKRVQSSSVRIAERGRVAAKRGIWTGSAEDSIAEPQGDSVPVATRAP